MLQYNDIKLEDISFFEYYWKITSQRASDYSFPILWGWAGDYGYRTARKMTRICSGSGRLFRATMTWRRLGIGKGLTGLTL